MFKPSNKDLIKAKTIIAGELPVAAGYRIIVKPLDSESGLKAGEVDKFETLAKKGIITQSEQQTERETKGSHAGIVCHVGDYAYSEALGGKPWVEVGQVIIFNRYAGQRVDIPPGSGDFYHFCNDEDVLGKYGEKL